MDRFSETFPSMNRRDRDEDGFPEPTYSAAGHQCENCRETVEHVSFVPEFDYYGCDACHAEALAEIARELAAQPQHVELTDQDTAETLRLLAMSRCTLTETALWMRTIEERIA